MQTLRLLIVFGLISFNSCSNKLTKATPKSVDDFGLIAIAKNDTISLVASTVLIAQVSNKTKKAFFFSDEFDITSNLFPNADFSSHVRKSASFHLELEPVAPFADITIENDIMSYPKSFTKINPKSVFKYKIELAKHIVEYNNKIKAASSKIATNKWYTLNLTFGQFGNWNQSDTFSGTIKARPIKFYLKE